MNNEGSRGFGERLDEEYVVQLLRDAATRLGASRVDPDGFVERLLTRGTDRLFTCDSPLGEVYVGVSGRGVRLVGRAASPEGFARRYRERFGHLLSWGTDERTHRLAQRVAAALAGEQVEVAAGLSGATPFPPRGPGGGKGI